MLSHTLGPKNNFEMETARIFDNVNILTGHTRATCFRNGPARLEDSCGG
jgi:hypothetical protein